jgi:hypothetical protein
MTLIDPADRRFVEGSDEDREAARREWHRQRLVAQVLSSSLPELARSDLAFHRSVL